MATTHRELSGAKLAWLCAAVVAYAPPAWAQQQTTKIEPTLNVQAYASSSSTATPGRQGPKDLVYIVTPGIGFRIRSALSQLDGQLKLDARSYVRKSQPNVALPSGQAALHTGAPEGGLGLDASLAVAQANGPSLTTTDGFTQGTAHLTPYYRRQLDPLTQAEVRLDRSLTHSRAISTQSVRPPDVRRAEDGIRLARQATPLGYRLDLQRQQTEFFTGGARVSAPDLTDQMGRATGLFAPLPEIGLGLTIGHEAASYANHNFSRAVPGWEAQWRPTERSLLKTEYEDRFFGKAWRISASHRLPWAAICLNAERNLSSSGDALQCGTLLGLYDAMLTTRTPNEQDRQQAVNDLVRQLGLDRQGPRFSASLDAAPQVRQASIGQFALMGRRDVLTFAGALARSNQLEFASVSTYTKEYYFDAQLTHRLSAFSTASTGLRWTRNWAVPLTTRNGVLTRDFTWRGAINTAMSRDTTATLGMKRQITHSPASTDETAAYIGLGHRF